MGSELSKGNVEVAVFLRFLTVSRLPIDPASVQKRDPPEPDILCTEIPDKSIAFELAEICDPILAEAIATESDEYLRLSDPSQRIIAKKLRRKYETEFPVELLCYTAGRVGTPDNLILPKVRSHLRSRRSVFRRAWLLGRSGVYLIWSAAG